MPDSLIELQKWQIFARDNPEKLIEIKRLYDTLRPIADGRVNPDTAPEHYTEALGTSMEIQETVAGLGLLVPTAEAILPQNIRFQEYMGTIAKLWEQHLHRCWEGKLAVSWDAAEAGVIQELIDTSQSTPATRPSDIPRGHTIRGDWDSTLTLKVVDGKLVHEGIGYIRKLEVVVADSFEIDFLEGVTKSDTGVIHEGLYSFERLSEATTFSEDGLKVWGIDEPRVVEGKGLLVEPEQTQLFTTRDWIHTARANTSSIATTIPEGSIITGVDGGVGREEWRVSKNISANGKDQSAAFVIDLGDSDVRYISVGTYPPGQVENHPYTNSYDLYEKKWAKYVPHISEIEVDNIGSVYFVRFTTSLLASSYTNVTVWMGNDGDDPMDNSKWSTLGDGQQVKLMYPQRTVSDTTLLSLIPNQDTPATRPPDLLALPSGYTVSGDYDEGINVDGTQVSGFGYIRKLILEKK